MVNDGAKNDYSNARSLYSDPEKYLYRMKGDERADQKYDPKLEEMIEERRLDRNKELDALQDEELRDRQKNEKIENEKKR